MGCTEYCGWQTSLELGGCGRLCPTEKRRLGSRTGETGISRSDHNAYSPSVYPVFDNSSSVNHVHTSRPAILGQLQRLIILRRSISATYKMEERAPRFVKLHRTASRYIYHDQETRGRLPRLGGGEIPL